MSIRSLILAGLMSLAAACPAPAQQVPGSGAMVPTYSPPATGPGSGTVTSVGLALPNIFSVSGSPVTASGTLTGALATQTANTILAGPTTGAAAAPTFRAAVLADLPTIGANTALGSIAGGAPAALTQTQLTSLVNVATASLTGAVPAWPNNTTTFFRGDGTYAAVPATAPGGSNLQVQYNNSGVFGGYTNTQLTALVNPATAALSGALPAWPGNTTTYFRGDGTYVTHNCAALTNSAASCSTDATNASNISSGTLAGAQGGTGVANTGKTITIGASLTTTGAGAPTLAFPGSSATYTYPTTTATLARTDAGQMFTGVQNFGAGSAATPNLAVGNATTGLYSVSTTGLGHSVNGADVLDYGITTSGRTTVVNGQLDLPLGTITTNIKALNITGTWNNAGTTFDAPLFMNITNTASNAASLLMDLQVGGATVFSVGPSVINIGNSGNYSVQGNWFGIVNNTISLGTNTSGLFAMAAVSLNGISTRNGGGIGWTNSNNTATSTLETQFIRDGAYQVAQVNGTNPNTFRVYNTSSASNANYERGVFGWTDTTNVLTIGTQNLGTGSARNMQFVIGGVTELDFGINNNGQWTFGPTINTGTISLRSNSVVLQFGLSSDTIISRPAAATLQFGAADAASPVAQTLQVQSVVAGNANTAGATFTIAGSKSNGSGGGDLVFQTTLSNAASGTQNTLATALTLKGGTQQATFSGQINVTAMTQTSAAQSGTVCYNSGTGAVTYDATLGCLTSTMEAKDDWHTIAPRDALALVTRLEAGSFVYKTGMGLPGGPQVGLNAQQVASLDERLVGRDTDGKLRGVRYQQASALYGPAMRALEDYLIDLRIANDNLRMEFDTYRRMHP